jgi:hypothetical protein
VVFFQIARRVVIATQQYITYTEFKTRYTTLYADELPFLTSPITETTIRLVRSSDGGATWSDPIGVSPTVFQAEGASEEGEGGASAVDAQTDDGEINQQAQQEEQAAAAPPQQAESDDDSGAWTPADAFDDAEDFERNDVLELAQARPGLFRGARVWLDVGRDDSFRDNTVRLGALVDVPAKTPPGEHSTAYWREHVDEYLRFYDEALRTCR